MNDGNRSSFSEKSYSVDGHGLEADGGASALVVHPDLGRLSPDARQRDPEARLAEAVGLAQAIALNVIHAEIARVAKPVPATLLGGGVVERLASVVDLHEISLVIVDAALSPVQQRNLENALGTKVIDRTGLILEIFGARARTHEGRLQVELAALTFQRSRLVRSWTHLERQRGGLGFIGGPGESQLEIDRRLIDERIAKLKRSLEDVRRTRGLHRAARERVPYPVVALVGYTNAGKSTLFNRLTGASVMAKDMLFATLDPTMRSIKLPSGRSVILSDTVGFISDLPTDLVAAFRATLEEVRGADILLHVRDIAAEDTEEARQDVDEILDSLELSDDLPKIEILNKIDLLAAEQTLELALEGEEETRPDRIGLSALSGQGVDTLVRALDEILARDDRELAFSIAYKDAAALSWLYDHGHVLERVDTEIGVDVTVRLSSANVARFGSVYPDLAVLTE